MESRWKMKYNNWRTNTDWKQFKSRDAIDQAIVNKLSAMLDDYEKQIDDLNYKNIDMAADVLVHKEIIKQLEEKIEKNNLQSS